MIRRFLVILAVAALAGAELVPSRPPTVAEMRLIVSAPVFRQWSKIEGLDPAKEATVSTATSTETHSFQVKSEYEVNRPGKSLVSFMSDVVIYGTPEEARGAFRGSISGYKKGVARVQGASMTENQPILTMGEHHYAAVLKQDGKPLGNFFVFTQGRVLHTLAVYGIVSTRHAQVRELLQPIYEASRQQFP